MLLFIFKTSWWTRNFFFSILNFPVVTFAIHSAVGKKPESIQDPNISKSDKDFKEKKNFFTLLECIWDAA